MSEFTKDEPWWIFLFCHHNFQSRCHIFSDNCRLYILFFLLNNVARIVLMLRLVVRYIVSLIGTKVCILPADRIQLIQLQLNSFVSSYGQPLFLSCLFKLNVTSYDYLPSMGKSHCLLQKAIHTRCECIFPPQF